MKRLIAILLFFVFNTAFAQEKGLLYEISGNNLQQPSYIFGTMHLLCKGDFVMSEGMISKIKSSEILAMEMDMDDPTMGFKMLGKMKMKGDTSLSDLMPPTRYDSLRWYLKDSLNLPPMMFQKTKPFLIYSLILTKLLPCETLMLENEIMKIGKGKKVVGLETLDFQMGLMDKMSYQLQADYLLETLAYKQKSIHEFQEMAEAYKKRDLEILLKSIKVEKGMMADFENEMLHKRNLAWIPEIKKLVFDKSTFIAVGAGHLGGEKGVLQLLKNEGFIVSTIE
ncbi:TraB/GumN family protein [Lacihabitans soyangensis]|uniref:TraB/GumN family protein n=1 Tax=Lacihabitans soyangensis TaxID=869394 RepID=A0AAE3H461_9BACT|nr:TraB/GumN family protein [Lacihabitans soyangensis]MCP9763880.1 TraB/GumN family protein [Lacihabitans soyangensis]